MTLALRDVESRYGDSQVLFGMELSVAPGEVATLLGRNGMGKTTTVRAIMGLQPVTAGEITFYGAPIHNAPAHRVARAGIGLVPEGRQIFPNLTLMENLVATASNHLGVADPWTVEKVFALFPELAERTSSMGNLLSGGEQQMLAIGRALMTNPKLLVLDEATEGLAPLVRRRIWEALAQISGQGMAILVVDKNLADLMKIAGRHYIIQRGTVEWSGTTAELQADEAVRRRYLEF